MKQIAFINDTNSDAPFAVIIKNNKKIQAFGVSPTGLAWANQSNRNNYSIDDIKSNIDIMLYLSGFNLLNENEIASLSGVMNDEQILQIRKLLDEETKSFKLTIKSDVPEEINSSQQDASDDDPSNELARLSISDTPIAYIDLEFKRDAIIYKAKAFRLDSQISSLRLEAKGVRAVFDPDARGGVGAWRCPEDTPYGGQFTNRFGRGCTWGVSRRLGRAFTAFAGQDIAKIGKLGRSLEERGDARLQRAGASANRRLDRRKERASRPPASTRVAERLASTLESAAGGIRASSTNRTQRRATRRTSQVTSKPKPAPSDNQEFFDSLIKRNRKLSLEDADFIYDARPNGSGWVTRTGDVSDSEWLQMLSDNVGDNKDGTWIAIPVEQVPYLARRTLLGGELNNRDFRKSINDEKKKLSDAAKKSKRTQRGQSPKQPPLAERLAARLAARGNAIRKTGTPRKERGRRPRPTETRRARAARGLARIATQVATDRGTARDTLRKLNKDKQGKRSQRRDLVLGTSSAKFFAKTPAGKYMPDMSTLTTQQQDDVKAAIDAQYAELFDKHEKLTLRYIARYKISKFSDAKKRKFKSKPGNLDMDEVIEATQKTPIINNGFAEGQMKTDLHNFQVLSEIKQNDDYSLIDELKPARRDQILIAAGVTPPPKRSRKKKKPAPAPAPAAAPTPPPAPAPSATPTPPPAPTPPPKPKPSPTPPPRPSAPPPPVKPQQATPKPPSATAEDITPVNKRDLTIAGVEPAGTLWMGEDVSGLIRVDRPNNYPLFRDPQTNRYIDLSESIVVDNPLDTIEFIDYPKVSKGPNRVAYPKKRADFNGTTVDREIFPGVSDKAFESWEDVIQQWPRDVAGHRSSVAGYQQASKWLRELGLDTESDQPLSNSIKLKLRSYLSKLDSEIGLDPVNKYAHTTFLRNAGGTPFTDELRQELHDILNEARKLLETDPNVTFKDLQLPEWILKVPIITNPFMDPMTAIITGERYWLGQTIINKTYPKIVRALITGSSDDLFEAYTAASTELSSLQNEMKSLLSQWRGPKKSATVPRRMAQVGFEIDALERMIRDYFSADDAVAKALQSRKRKSYARSVLAGNDIIDRAERRQRGELKVGGKLDPETLRPKEGVIRDTATLKKLLTEHKSPQLFNEAGSADPGITPPPLNDDEFALYNRVQDAYSSTELPDGRTVKEIGASGGGSGESDGSIAELYMTLELNGYNDLPLQVSSEEFAAALAEKDDSGKPLWFMMSRYLSANSNRPEVSSDEMVMEYLQGQRWPVGMGAAAGGRGDNFASREGYSGYGNSGIGALISSDSRITNRHWLDKIAEDNRRILLQLAQSRHVKIKDFDTFTGTPINDQELMDKVDELKSAMLVDTPLRREASGIASTLIEHWLQLELSKRTGPNLSDNDKEWNERLSEIQLGIFNMDAAQVAVFAGYDGYVSSTPSFMRDENYDNSQWSSFADNAGNSLGQIIWLNRTALVVLDHVMTHAEATQLASIG